MILWKKFKGIPAILEKVDMVPQSNMSETFLVMWRFKGKHYENGEFEARPAHILKHGHRSPEQYVILVSGITGNIEISHWTEITKIKNKP